MKIITIISLFTAFLTIIPTHSFCIVMPPQKLEQTYKKQSNEVSRTPPNEWIVLVAACVFGGIGFYSFVKGIIIFWMIRNAAYAIVFILPIFLIVVGLSLFLIGFNFYRLYLTQRKKRLQPKFN